MNYTSYLFKFRFILLLLSGFIVFSTSGSSHASVYIADVIGRYLPTINLAMEPGAYEKIKLLPGNEDNSGGMIAMSFDEERDFYGFSVLICDEKNAKLYENRKSAACFRKEIDLKSDILRYKFKGSEAYYMFVVNRTKPLSTTRKITIVPYLYTAMNAPVRERLESRLNLMNEQLDYFFGLEPLNYAVIPCQKTFIPSSIENRTLTICSELMIGEDAVPNKDLLLGAIAYELTSFLKHEWEIKEIRDNEDRLEFTSMLIMLFSKNKKPFTDFLNLWEQVTELEGILKKYPQYDQKMSLMENVNELIEINNDSFTKIDQWLHITYDNMTNAILEQIREGDYRHFGFLRDTARVVLKRRYEQELRAKNPQSDEPKNIISDFW